jgi:7-cyano-7-deazaguanine synthase
VLLSGGIDSATCLYLTKAECRVRALTFQYYRMSQRELWSARALAEAAGVREHRIVRLPDLKEAGDLGRRFDGLPSTYVPLRNSVFYSLAASYAEETGADRIVGGHIRSDRETFADATPKFFTALEKALWTGSKVLGQNRTRILLPVGEKSKAEVVKLAVALGVPLESTWSCHRGGSTHCWNCEGCSARTDAFEKAWVADPLRKVRPQKIT